MAALNAHATIAFPKLNLYLEKIVTLLGDHDMRVEPRDGGYVVTAPFGTARLTPGAEKLGLSVEAEDGSSLNRIKHVLTNLIDFVARAENPRIVWSGDKAGDTAPTDLRVLTVHGVVDLTPHMRRVRFKGDDLALYDVADQIHCRLLFQPRDVIDPQWPKLGDDGRIVWPKGGQQLASRIYTIRRINPDSKTIDIDFYLHGADGAGVRWIREAAPGRMVGMLGPGGHGSKPADWNVLVGDETGLPGIARIVEELPPSARGIALIEIADAAEEQKIVAPSGVEIRWLHRNGARRGTADLLENAVRSLEWPEDFNGTFFWCGCEYAAFRSIRHFLRDTVKLPKDRQVAFAHWRRGMSNDDIIEAGGDVVSD
ncbi:siderophore-interacting protein [Bosea rubneri]|uniref:Siderophore-interacting protein n=1 Tax=Bosea rubneri TaxID=3075434 RepID=A0ABU3SDL0_9HYPH|nr:siderophore-interacting protein [Bosea sp. ZW T0_25]MDU0342879.1 siderophore-interacting protein [Bosea sp. ZW T0_25]